MRFTTDMGDWRTIPIRLRVALAIGLAGAVALGLATGLGLVGLTTGVLVIANFPVVVQWVFTRRRPWWRGGSEAGPDVLDQDFSRRLAAVTSLDAIAALAVWAGLVRL